MASVNLDDSNGVLEDRFLSACEYVFNHRDKSMPLDTLCTLYGFFKQATVGPCDTPKPPSSSFFDLKAKYMWKSWSALGSMSKRDAMRSYVRCLDETAPDWDAAAAAATSASSAAGDGPAWISVSSPSRDEDEVPDAAKDIFDWAKEGDVEKVRQLCKKNVRAVDRRDGGGLTALHWAADHGHVDVVRCLVAEMKADVNCVDGDGQTPLHYAAACGYSDVCRLLVERGAEVAAKDKDGLSPVDAAEETSIKELFRDLKIS